MTTPRDDTPICCYCDNTLSCAHCGKEQPDNAATQLAALSARVKELEVCRTEADRQAVYLSERIASLEARALRAEQEGDEAYERAADTAMVQAKQGATAEQIAAAIRRLAPGPEKEGKE